MESPVPDATVDEPFDLLRNPYPMFAERRRESSGIFEGSVMDWSKAADLRPKNLYAAVSFDAVNRVFRDGQAFNSRIYDSTIGLFIGPTMLAMEGRTHWQHRNLVSAAFKSKSLQRWEPAIVRPVVNALINEFVDDGRADLVTQFTFEFPTRVITKLLGLPEEDLPWFRQRAIELISYHIRYQRAFEASAALKDYFLQQIELRRSTPTEDIIGDLVSAEIDGEKLTDEAIYSFLRLLLPAGLETTYRSSGNLIYLLLTHPEQFRAVQDNRELVASAIEEGLRYETPLTTVQRSANSDTDVEGVAIPKGAVIDVCIGSANRDEKRWERSEEFDIFRNRLPHISFAAGEHTCMGLHLARMETRVAFETLLDRITDIELVTDDDPHVWVSRSAPDRASGDVHRRRLGHPRRPAADRLGLQDTAGSLPSTALASDATVLVSAERCVGAVEHAAVDPEGAGADSVRDVHPALHRPRHHRAGQTEGAVVGDPDRVVVVGERKHDQHRSEHLPLRDRGTVVHPTTTVGATKWPPANSPGRSSAGPPPMVISAPSRRASSMAASTRCF